MSSVDRLPNEVVVMVPTGALGGGIRPEHVEQGLKDGAQAIACDAGSTDSGPSYLARGVSKWNREAIKRDLEVLMIARAKAGIPLLVGSCGTSGCDDATNWTRDIVLELAEELGQSPKIAVLYSEQDPRVLRAKLAEGKVHPLSPLGPLTGELLDKCDHIVALMGPEPYIEALTGGADIVLGGRTTDTAVLAALPLMLGAGPGPSWHAGKTAECGGMCTDRNGDGGVTIRVGSNAFDVSPLNLVNHCTVNTVSAHMLYENSDPYSLTEPGGVLDVHGANYEQLDDITVRVVGSKWLPRPYTMKLEGAGGGSYQTISMVGIEDPKVLANLNVFHDRLHAALCDRIDRTFGAEAGDYDVSLRLYGWNGVSGRVMPADETPPKEVAVLLVITAATQSLATRMSKACNPLFFHFPLDRGMPIPSYAFPFTPAEIERGQVFEFYLNHVVDVADPMELVRMDWIDLKAKAKEFA
jgi:hypothetical protein